jgi:5-aminopentanamidase
LRVFVVQAKVAFGDPEANLAYAIGKLEEAVESGADLVVFPEAFLTGYCVECSEGAHGIGIDERESGGVLERLGAECDRLDLVCVVGYACARGGRLYNTAALFEPGQLMRTYDKTHLPELGLDKFVAAGERLDVFDTRVGRIGILICFDLRHPEASRVLALQGADLLVLPTNWPEGAEVSADHIAVARAAESRIFVVTCNRTGDEHGFRFIGRSKVIHPTGRVLAAAGGGEEVLVADLDLEDARTKRTVTIPGRYEVSVFDSRRPELYGRLSVQQGEVQQFPAEARTIERLGDSHVRGDD